MIAIETKFLGPTTYRGSRIKAYAANGQQSTVNWDYSINGDQNHERAANALLVELGLADSYALVGGHTSKGMTWIITDHLTHNVY